MTRRAAYIDDEVGCKAREELNDGGTDDALLVEALQCLRDLSGVVDGLEDGGEHVGIFQSLENTKRRGGVYQ